MKRILGMLCVVCGLAAAVAVRAQTATPPTYVLTTVDSVRRYGSYLYVTGVVEGASDASEVGIYDASTGAIYIEACERYALMAIAKPGQYRLEVWPGRANYTFGYCRLSRVNP